MSKGLFVYGGKEKLEKAIPLGRMGTLSAAVPSFALGWIDGGFVIA